MQLEMKNDAMEGKDISMGEDEEKMESEIGDVESEEEFNLNSENSFAPQVKSRSLKKIQKQILQLKKYERKECDLNENIIITLNAQLEEVKSVEEVVRTQLKAKEECCEKLDYEIVSLRMELDLKHLAS